MNESEANKIYVFDAKAHGHVLRENAELRRKLDQAGAANHAAFQTLLGALKTRPLALDGLAQIAELAAERIWELEYDNAALYDALRGVEREGALDEGIVGRCPECDQRKRQGHAPDCKVFRALNQREQTINPKPQGDRPMPCNEEVDPNNTVGQAMLEVEWDDKARAAQAELEAEMKKRLDAILEGQSVAAIRTQDLVEMGARVNAEIAEERESQLREEAPPKQEQLASGGTRRITPETAPVGARILVRQIGDPFETPFEVTIHEWAPSGKRVLVYDREGRMYWSEGLPRTGVLVETLPPAEPQYGIGSAYAGMEAQRMVDKLAELLKDKLGAAATMENLDKKAKARLATPDDRRERLAAYAHEAWAGWMDYLFSKCVYHADGKVVIPQKSFDHWTRQMKTTYQDLPEAEKASARAEADKMLAITEARVEALRGGGDTEC